MFHFCIILIFRDPFRWSARFEGVQWIVNPSPQGKGEKEKRMSITPITPDSKKDIIRGICALEFLLGQTENDEKSKEIYKRTLKAYKDKLKKLGGQ